MTEPLIVPDEVYRQLEATRESGKVNMLTEIEWGLRQFGFQEALDWVKANEQDYIEHAMSGGFQPESEADEPLPASEVK